MSAGFRKHQKKTGLFVTVAMVGGFMLMAKHLSYGADADRKSARENRTTTVAVAKAKTANIHVYLTGLGTVTSFNTTVIKSRVDGQLMALRFRDGQTVKAGDALADIDPRPYQAALQQAAGQLARDQALLGNAKTDLQRYQDLFAEDSVSKQQLDTQEALAKQDESAIRTDEGLIDNAKVQLSYCHITAPVSGRLGLRQVDPGNIVHASDANGLVVITQLQPINVVFSLPEDNIPAVSRAIKQAAGEKGLSVEAWDRALKNKISSGNLVTVDNQIDPTTGSVKLKAQFSNDDTVLFPNQFVNVRMQVDVKRNAVVVPSSAVQLGRDGYYVYIVGAAAAGDTSSTNKTSTVSLRSVTIGATEDDNVAVASGLAENETVVTDGVDQLRDGATVQVVQNDNPATEPATKSANITPEKTDAAPAVDPATEPHHHRHHE
jgi:multidrug efflux system membrane fusion protein